MILVGTPEWLDFVEDSEIVTTFEHVGEWEAVE